ncbi:MAG: hypothetical protein ACYC1M_13635 [Armatimonadota bacterium]
MKPNDVNHQFNTDARKIDSCKKYADRYAQHLWLRNRWGNPDAVSMILKSNLEILEPTAMKQLLSLCYDLVSSQRCNTKQLVDHISKGNHGKHLATLINLFVSVWNQKNDPKKLGNTVMTLVLTDGLHTETYVDLAGSGDRLLPYITNSLYFYRKIDMVTISITKFLVAYTNSMIYAYSAASPDARCLISAYKRFDTDPHCRQGIVRGLSKYPSDCTAVYRLMQQIKSKDTDREIRQIAADYIRRHA